MDTFEDIVNNPGFSIAGSQAIKGLALVKPDIFAKLIQRVESYEKSLGIKEKDSRTLRNDRLMRDVFERKAVLIVNSLGATMLKNFYPFYNFEASEHKLNHLFRYSYVTKSHVNHKQIHRL